MPQTLEEKINAIAKKEEECGFVGVSFSVAEPDYDEAKYLETDAVVDYVYDSLLHAEECIKNIESIPFYKDGVIVE